MTNNIDFTTILANAIALAANANPAAVAAATPAAPAVTLSEDGKIVLPKTTKTKAEREDARIPETIVHFANDEHGRPLTVGFSKTFKDDKGKSYNYGFGVEHYDDNGKKTMTYMTARKWQLLAQIAPLVAKAISEKYA